MSALQTAADQVHTSVLLLVDEDDPQLLEYQGLFPGGTRTMPADLGFSGCLNVAAEELWDSDDLILGAFGDDVIFRTPGWDRIVAETLATPGIAYGDDLIHGQNHPSAVFVSAFLARTLGWLAMPYSRHQWVDDGWKRIGQETHSLRFMAGVILEHMHPVVGKAEMDDGYRRVFDGERAKCDFDGFTAWAKYGLAHDSWRVSMALALEREKATERRE